MADTIENEVVDELKQKEGESPVAYAMRMAEIKAKAAAETSTAVSTDTTGGAVGAAVAPGRKLTMNELMIGSMAVDGWLKVNEFGIRADDGANCPDAVNFLVDMTEGVGFFAKKCIKAGNPAQYWSSYDGITCNSGGSWNDATAKARGIDAAAREYSSADIIFVVEEDVTVVPKKGAAEVVAFTKGTKLGHSLSTTNWNNWASLYREIEKAGLTDKLVRVSVESEERTNKNNNTWGILKFTLVGDATPEESE